MKISLKSPNPRTRKRLHKQTDHNEKAILFRTRMRIEIMSTQAEPRLCIVNVGLFRSGTTTLAAAAHSIGMKTFREFPALTSKEHKDFLLRPSDAVRQWWYSKGGRDTVIELAKKNNLICDGWIALLPFLPPEELWNLQTDMQNDNVIIQFVATIRNVEATIQSELQHWTIHNLERKSCLSPDERMELETLLRSRAVDHASRIAFLNRECEKSVCYLKLEQHNEWASTLGGITSYDSSTWQNAFGKVGIQNANPALPVEGILLTLRIGTGVEAQESMHAVSKLLDSIERDSLCRYLVVLGIDSDEAYSKEATALKDFLKARPRVDCCSVIVNQYKSPDEPFHICSSWNEMAKEAFSKGAADWVVLLGDDIEIDAPCHYRAFYRAFLDISERLECPFGFGCPWWHDSSFPGFPTFPVVGKAHFEVFGGLIPRNRLGSFVNQDLDPYLQRLYLKFGAAPVIEEARLTNRRGGNDTKPARYSRVPAIGWRDWVLEDVTPIRQYLDERSLLAAVSQFQIVDVVVPSYRIDVPFLERICSLKVPTNFRTTFIVVIDNPVRLLVVASALGAWTTDMNEAACALEQHLVNYSKEAQYSVCGNNVRVRCNQTNIGASASRNRGLDESAAEFVLFLDDDVIPDANLLESYGKALEEYPEESESNIVGLLGLVRFPRCAELPLKHAAVLMSNLAFMFEIADNPHYTRPAWGVTANILVKRATVRFDTAYAKTGGGEDVDFCLRLAREKAGEFIACPPALVHHPFWPGSPVELSKHFFNWAIGDSALFSRFPEHCYRSWPNAVEFLSFTIPALMLAGISYYSLLLMIVLFVMVDVAVEISDIRNYHHRCSLLMSERPTWFYVLSHVLANFYVLILESGRLWGHLKRGDVKHFARRFDWHCGRLDNSCQKFRRQEFHKFTLFCSVVVALVAYHVK